MQAANLALKDSEAQLERRVIERTRDLQIASEVSRQATSLLDPNQLLPTLVEKTRTAFDLYFVSVFLYQPEAKRFVLVAGTGEAGRRMIEEAKTYQLDERPSLVARAGRERQAVIISDTQAEATHAFNPHLPETRTEAQLPMIVGDELVGILGLQSTELNRFTQENIDVFLTLAEQIGIALKNAQLFDRQTVLTEELKQADKLKSQFIASMSHELRTPLNGIINFTELVASGMMGEISAEQTRLLEQSLESSNHLLNLINDVLDINKIQAGKLTLLFEDNIHLDQEIESVIKMIEHRFQNSPVALIQEVEPGLPAITGDSRRIRQILLNLLTNAIKFTPEGTVTLKVNRAPGGVLFQVVDTGAGIPADMHAMIFEPFIQTKDGIKQSEGTGLGLAIVRELVAAHNGKIWLESAAGEGSTFSFTLPAE